MEGIAWVFSIVLAIVFLITGIIKAYRYDIAVDRFPWVTELPEVIVRILGQLEILGAMGLILPLVIGNYPLLAPIAASSLAILMLMAVAFHMRRHDSDNALTNLMLAIMCLAVAYIRWTTIPIT